MSRVKDNPIIQTSAVRCLHLAILTTILHRNIPCFIGDRRAWVMQDLQIIDPGREQLRKKKAVESTDKGSEWGMQDHPLVFAIQIQLLSFTCITDLIFTFRCHPCVGLHRNKPLSWRRGNPNTSSPRKTILLHIFILNSSKTGSIAGLCC